MATSIRPAVAADAGRIADILTQEGYPTRSGSAAARLERFSADDGAVYVAESGGETIGFIALHTTTSRSGSSPSPSTRPRASAAWAGASWTPPRRGPASATPRSSR
jgi:hypothetical protein